MRVHLFLFVLALPLAAVAQTEAELKHYAELDRQCEAARQQKLTPLRARKIDACVNRDKRPRAECEDEFANYGNTHARTSGGAVGGLFYDLPECVAAQAARNEYRQ